MVITAIIPIGHKSLSIPPESEASMLTLDQKVTVECTDTGVTASGKIIRIRPDGFDVALGDLIIRLYRHKPQIYVGNQSGMEFVVRT